MFPGGTEVLIIILVIVVLFGASRIPKVMKGMGEGMRSFKDGLEGGKDAPVTPKKEPEALEESSLESELRGNLGRLVEYSDGVLTIGVADGKKVITVQDGLLKLEGKGSIETVQIASIEKIVEVKS